MHGRIKRISSLLRAMVCTVLFSVSLTLPGGSLDKAAAAPPLRNHIVGIGNCPLWKPQSPEICQHSLETVVKMLVQRLNAEPDSTRSLLNETATADSLKRKITELSNTLGPEDRLVLYLNLPLALAEDAETMDLNAYVLELWADEEPETVDQAISDGLWVSAPAFAAMLHAIKAAEVIVFLDTNTPHAVNLKLLDNHAVDHDSRPEALISSAGAGQVANYSADRTISLFAKHLAVSLKEADGTLLDIVTAAASGTRQASIPICAELKENLGVPDGKTTECKQVPEIHDPAGLLARTPLSPLSEADTQN